MKKPFFMPARAGISVFAGIAMLFFFTPAQAAPFTYSSPDCDFTATFPEKPFIEKKCDTANKCEEIATYVQTTDKSAVNFRLSCRKAEPKDLTLLTPDDLKKRLGVLVKEANLMPYANDAAVLKNGTKTSIALATGKRGEQDVIYTGQMWIGLQSVLTMEGEMTGPENEEINDIYSEILRAVQIKKMP